MSVILIQGMDIPKSCIDCWNCDRNFNDGDSTVSDWMCLLRMRFVNEEENNRPDWCPLISVPTHGRLIDADALSSLCDIMADKCNGIGKPIWRQFRATVDWSPTVIPADPEAEGERRGAEPLEQED